MLEEGFRVASWGSQHGLAQRCSLELQSGAGVPAAASPCPHLAAGALLRAAGTPSSSSKKTQRSIWALAPLPPRRGKAAASVGCPPGVPCTGTHQPRRQPCVFSTEIQRERVFLRLFCCFNKFMGCHRYFTMGHIKSTAQALWWSSSSGWVSFGDWDGGRREVWVLPQAQGVPLCAQGGPELARAGPESHGWALLDHGYLGGYLCLSLCWCCEK